MSSTHLIPSSPQQTPNPPPPLQCVVRCPLCGVRKAKRACPAQGRHICSVCCGSKRLVEIACPADCAYLAVAREHPPAVDVRRYEDDMARMAPVVRDFSQRQGEIFVLMASVVLTDTSTDFHVLLDDDVADAAGALASTLETAARGVIYEHRPSTRAAERLMTAFTGVLAEAGKAAGGGARLERETVLVLRRLEEAARGSVRTAPRQGRAFIELLGRIIRLPQAPQAPGEASSRLILP